VPWHQPLDAACRRTARAIREGSPTITLRPRLATGPRHLVEPLLRLNAVSVLFGDGGAGKGYAAVGVGLAVKHAKSLPSGLIVSKPAEVLYCDWESSVEDLEDRAYRLARGLGCSGEALHYRRMGRALADEASALRAEISRLRIGLLVIDSLAPACGAEPEGADAAVRAYNAIRSFGSITTLVIAHCSRMRCVSLVLGRGLQLPSSVKGADDFIQMKMEAPA
jgi:AAA domain